MESRKGHIAPTRSAAHGHVRAVGKCRGKEGDEERGEIQPPREQIQEYYQGANTVERPRSGNPAFP